MKPTILVICEESQAITKAFRKRGFNAWSCDILPCSGGHPEWHFQIDYKEVLWRIGQYPIMSEAGNSEFLYQVDLIIAHPPCTYLTISGNAWFDVEKYGYQAIQRKRYREEAVQFFMDVVNNCTRVAKRVAIENPVGIMSTRYRKPDQYIQPYEFGHPCRKKTGLWLYNLPNLVPTNIVEPELTTLPDGKKYSDWHLSTFGLPAEERRKLRSKTFQGIAEAIADQWGKVLLIEKGEIDNDEKHL